MSIARELAQTGRGPLLRSVARIVGGSDLHTHIRVRPLVQHLSVLLPKGPVRVVECGCGPGVNVFEIAKLNRSAVIEGYDLDSGAIEFGKLVKQEFFCDRAIELRCADVTQLGSRPGAYDCVLLMDVLEHIADDGHLARWATQALATGGLLCVSVPTPKYSRVFGLEFHRQIGHLRPGYTLPELRALFPALQLAGAWYNTGLIAQLGCSLYYRHLRKIRSRVLRAPLALLLRLLFAGTDWPNSAERSCSLFAIFTKPPLATGNAL